MRAYVPQRSPLHAWSLANIAGVILYLAISATIWVPEAQTGLDQPGSGGDAFVWGIYLVPLLGIFAVGNLIFIGKRSLVAIRTKSLLPIIVPVSIVALWVLVLVLEHLKVAT